MKHCFLRKSQQGGAALIISLIMLILVSLIAAGGFLLTTTEARGAANWSDRQRALFIAESALLEAVDQVTAKRTAGTAVEDLNSAVSGVYDKGDFNALSGWPSNATCSNATTPLSGTQACYVIVFDGLATQDSISLAGATPPKSARFTFYARAGGLRDGSFVVLSTSRAFD